MARGAIPQIHPISPSLATEATLPRTARDAPHVSAPWWTASRIPAGARMRGLLRKAASTRGQHRRSERVPLSPAKETIYSFPRTNIVRSRLTASELWPHIFAKQQDSHYSSPSFVRGVRAKNRDSYESGRNPARRVLTAVRQRTFCAADSCLLCSNSGNPYKSTSNTGFSDKAISIVPAK